MTRRYPSRLPSRPVLVRHFGRVGTGSLLSDISNFVDGSSSSSDSSGGLSTDTSSTDNTPVEQGSGVSTPIDNSGNPVDMSGGSPNFVSPPPGPTGLAAVPAWAWVAGAGLVAVLIFEVARK